MSRPSWDRYFLYIVQVVASRGTCVRRRVGCVLTSARKQILSTGYNGPATGQPHCIETPCAGSALPSGQGLDLCEAVHAEQNALLQCEDIYQIERAYVSCAPCVHCIKLLLQTSCKEVIFLEGYNHASESKRLWESSGRKWTHAEPLQQCE